MSFMFQKLPELLLEVSDEYIQKIYSKALKAGMFLLNFISITCHLCFRYYLAPCSVDLAFILLGK